MKKKSDFLDREYVHQRLEGSHRDGRRLRRESSIQEGSDRLRKVWVVESLEVKVQNTCGLSSSRFGEYEQLFMEALASRQNVRLISQVWG